jgi:hypothetical protein
LINAPACKEKKTTQNVIKEEKNIQGTRLLITQFLISSREKGVEESLKEEAKRSIKMPPIPNEGILWFRPTKNSQFRKHTVSIKSGSTIQLSPSTFSFLSRKVVVDVSKMLIQIIPAALVTSAGASETSNDPSTAAAGNAPPSGGSASANPELADTSVSPRFHQVYSYICFVDRANSADTERLIFRTIDDYDRDRWFQFFLHLSGNTQSMQESYPYGKIGKKGAVESTGSPQQKRPGDAVSVSSSSSSSSESNVESRVVKRARRKSRRMSGSDKSSIVLEGIPMVSVTGESSRKSRSASLAKRSPESFQLVVEEASSTDSDPEKDTRMFPKAIPKPLVARLPGERRPTTWHHTPEANTEALDGPNNNNPPVAASSNPFLAQLWKRCREDKDPYLFCPKEVAPVVTQFAGNVVAADDRVSMMQSSSAHGIAVLRIEEGVGADPVVALATVSPSALVVAPQMTWQPTVLVRWAQVVSVIPFPVSLDVKELPENGSSSKLHPATSTTTTPLITSKLRPIVASLSASSTTATNNNSPQVGGLTRSATQRTLKKPLLVLDSDDDDDPLEKSGNSRHSASLGVSFLDLDGSGQLTPATRSRRARAGSAVLPAAPMLQLPQSNRTTTSSYQYPLQIVYTIPVEGSSVVPATTPSQEVGSSVLHERSKVLEIRFHSATDRKLFLRGMNIAMAAAEGSTSSAEAKKTKGLALLKPVFRLGDNRDDRVRREESLQEGWAAVALDMNMFEMVQCHMIGARATQ